MGGALTAQLLLSLAQSRRAWAQQVCERHRTRDPAKLARAQRQGEMRSRARSHYLQACAMQTSSAMTSHAYAHGMRRAARAQRPEEMREAAETASRQMLAVRSVQQRAASDCDDEEAEEDEMASAGALVLGIADELGIAAPALPAGVGGGASRSDPAPPAAGGLAAAVAGYGVAQVAATTVAVGTDEMDGLLEKLRVEPDDDEQRAALFKMCVAHLK